MYFDRPDGRIWKREMLRLGVEKGVDRETAQEWLDTYGTNTLRIYDRLPEPPLTPEQLLRAQIQYAVEEEMTVHAVDFLRLRTGWTYFQLHKAEEQAERVVRLMADERQWDDAETARQREMIARLIASIRQLPESDEALEEGTRRPLDRESRCN